MYPAGNLFIPISHGRLEAIYRPKSNAAERAALVLHPHPLHGGTMHNKVVFRTAKALEEAGYATLRFNFRGVGHSTGTHDDGKGEIDDARTALEYLIAAQPSAREVLVAGFSFGSIVGLKLGCSDPRVHRLIGVGVPARLSNLEFLAGCPKPKLFVHGVLDEIAPLAPLEAALEQLPDPTRQIVRIPGAGHFFDDQAPELMQAIQTFVA